MNLPSGKWLWGFKQNLKFFHFQFQIFFSLQQHKKYKTENNKHGRLKAAFPQGISGDIARNIASEKK